MDQDKTSSGIITHAKLNTCELIQKGDYVKECRIDETESKCLTNDGGQSVNQSPVPSTVRPCRPEQRLGASLVPATSWTPDTERPELRHGGDVRPKKRPMGGPCNRVWRFLFIFFGDIR